jgi:hypothetical protein
VTQQESEDDERSESGEVNLGVAEASLDGGLREKRNRRIVAPGMM